MVDYSQFEASAKSGIHADVSRIRQKDEIIKAVVKKRRSSAIICVCFLCMAIANMTARDGAAAVNGCYCLEVKELDGAQKILFEKIPCSCFFCYEGGDYHSSFQPHPLYWGTTDQQSIQEALRQVEEDNKENTKDEWEVLKEVARQFPDLGNGNLILLNENYVPFGKKNYMDSNYKPLNEEADTK